MASTPDPILRTSVAGIELDSPVILAAGTAGTIDETLGVVPLEFVGAVVCKSVTVEPRDGNAPWRILGTRTGMLNAIGLANPGVERFVSEYADRAAGLRPAVFASAAGSRIEDYVSVVAQLDPLAAPDRDARIPAIELNVSCPNVSTGLEFGRSPDSLGPLVRECRAVARHARLIVKLSPIVTDPVGVARAAIDAGADALTIANTVPAMEIDVESQQPRLANVMGGLSGPAIHPIAVHLVHLVHQGVARDAGVPILGAGGVMNWKDAAQLILAGASAVQIGTGLFADPGIPRKVARGLTGWARRKGVSGIGELVGAVKLA